MHVPVVRVGVVGARVDGRAKRHAHHQSGRAFGLGRRLVVAELVALVDRAASRIDVVAAHDELVARRTRRGERIEHCDVGFVRCIERRGIRSRAYVAVHRFRIRATRDHRNDCNDRDVARQLEKERSHDASVGRTSSDVGRVRHRAARASTRLVENARLRARFDASVFRVAASLCAKRADDGVETLLRAGSKGRVRRSRNADLSAVRWVIEGQLDEALSALETKKGLASDGFVGLEPQPHVAVASRSWRRQDPHRSLLEGDGFARHGIVRVFVRRRGARAGTGHEVDLGQAQADVGRRSDAHFDLDLNARRPEDAARKHRERCGDREDSTGASGSFVHASTATPASNASPSFRPG